MPWQLSATEAARVMGAKYHGPEMILKGIATDSREKMPGKLFVALKGERFDAHDFLPGAIENQCAAVLVSENRPQIQSARNVGVFQVKDTLLALQTLAADWRVRNSFFVIGISGSNGKTSTKEITYQLIKDFKKAHASQGSFNNHWGVPFSILGASAEDKVLVLEMGMNHKGELTRLSEIAKPDITVITMVGTAHIGELGSQQAIAEAKEELYIASPRSIACFNLDNEFTRDMYARARAAGTHPRLLTFSSHVPRCDVELRAERMGIEGLEISGTIGEFKGQCTIKAFGRHNLVNIMAASSLALGCGMPAKDVWKKLSEVVFESWGRNQWLKLSNGAHVLFDGYNANPESMTALIKNVFELDVPGRRIFVLGEMRELGDKSAYEHEKLGELAASVSPEIVWFMGDHSADFEKGFKRATGSSQLFVSSGFETTIADRLRKLLLPTDIIALKASRGQKIETVLQHWGLEP